MLALGVKNRTQKFKVVFFHINVKLVSTTVQQEHVSVLIRAQSTSTCEGHLEFDSSRRCRQKKDNLETFRSVNSVVSENENPSKEIERGNPPVFFPNTSKILCEKQQENQQALRLQQEHLYVETCAEPALVNQIGTAALRSK